VAQEILKTGTEGGQERFERILSQPLFEGLRAILERVSPDQATLYAAVEGASLYEQVLARLGYELTLTKQIHVQDAYSRLAPAGGIRAVLPYYDIPTQSSFPTLLNLDNTVTTTAKGVAFFSGLFGEFKMKLSAPA
jgi:hypothetical protein